MDEPAAKSKAAKRTAEDDTEAASPKPKKPRPKPRPKKPNPKPPSEPEEPEVPLKDALSSAVRVGAGQSQASAVPSRATKPSTRTQNEVAARTQGTLRVHWYCGVF